MMPAGGGGRLLSGPFPLRYTVVKLLAALMLFTVRSASIHQELRQICTRLLLLYFFDAK
jgi:hypothetical protein